MNLNFKKLIGVFDKELTITPKEYGFQMILWTFAFGSVTEMQEIFNPITVQYYWMGYVYLLMAFLFSWVFMLRFYHWINDQEDKLAN